MLLQGHFRARRQAKEFQAKRKERTQIAKFVMNLEYRAELGLPHHRNGTKLAIRVIVLKYTSPELYRYSLFPRVPARQAEHLFTFQTAKLPGELRDDSTGGDFVRTFEDQLKIVWWPLLKNDFPPRIQDASFQGTCARREVIHRIAITDMQQKCT